MTATLDSLVQQLTRDGWQQVPATSDTPMTVPKGPYFFVAPPNPGYEEEGRDLCLHNLPTPEGIKVDHWSDFLLVIKEDAADQRVIGTVVEDCHGGAIWGVRGWNGMGVAFEWAETVIKKALRYWDEEIYLEDDGSSALF